MGQQRKTRGWGAVTTGAGGAVLATAAMACCVPVLAPLLVSTLGVTGSIWAAGLKPYSLLILLASGVFLGYGFWTVYRRRPVAVGDRCSTNRPKLQRVVLWVSAVLWGLALSLNVLQLLASRI